MRVKLWIRDACVGGWPALTVEFVVGFALTGLVGARCTKLLQNGLKSCLRGRLPSVVTCSSVWPQSIVNPRTHFVKRASSNSPNTAVQDASRYRPGQLGSFKNINDDKSALSPGGSRRKSWLWSAVNVSPCGVSWFKPHKVKLWELVIFCLSGTSVPCY